MEASQTAVDQLADAVLAKVEQRLAEGGAPAAVAGANKVAADAEQTAHDVEATVEKVPILDKLREHIANSPEAHFAEHLAKLAEEGYAAVVGGVEEPTVMRAGLAVLAALVKGA